MTRFNKVKTVAKKMVLLEILTVLSVIFCMTAKLFGFFIVNAFVFFVL